MTLFQQGIFKLHSGKEVDFKIDCDALSEDDIDGLAFMVWSVTQPFENVEGVPRGGLRLAHALERYQVEPGNGAEPLLIVDDVLTTGNSMDEQRAGRHAMGVVIFSRAPVGMCPSWVNPIFQMCDH